MVPATSVVVGPLFSALEIRGLQAVFIADFFEVALLIVYVVGIVTMIQDQKGNSHQSCHVKTDLWSRLGKATTGAMAAAARTNTTESLI